MFSVFNPMRFESIVCLLNHSSEYVYQVIIDLYNYSLAFELLSKEALKIARLWYNLTTGRKSNQTAIKCSYFNFNYLWAGLSII